MQQMQAIAHKLFRDREGATVLEYAVAAALVIAVVVVVIWILGGQVRQGLESFNTAFETAKSGQ